MLARLRSLARALLHRNRLEDDMAAELREHIQRRARVEFGSLEATKEECREARDLLWADELVRAARYGLRMLRRDPVFTVTSALTLSLCIGANTAVFSVVDAVLLRPLPYPEPDRLVQVVRFFRARGMEGMGISQTGSIWELVRDQATFLDAAVFSAGTRGVNFAAQGRVEYVQQQRVSAGFFRVLGVSPAFGREFTPEEDRVGGPPVAVLSHGLWQRIFAGDPAVLGRPVTLRGEPYTIVGVMPPAFQTDAPAGLWAPLRPAATGEGSGMNYQLVGRLRPGVSWTQADSEIEAVGAEALRQIQLPPGASVRLRLVPLQRGLTENHRQPLLILFSAVGVVLLIGCVNIAGLLLARNAARAREIATRLALGGGRGAVVRQLLTESLLLALLGGAAGVLVARLCIEGLKILAREGLGIHQQILLDARVLALTAGVSLAASLLPGLAPALDASRINIHSTLIEGGGRGIAGRRRHWPRRLLVIGEVALGFVLLAGAGLLIRTFAYLHNLRPGFDPANLITARLSLQDARYAAAPSVNRFFEESLARIRQLPGVESAAVALSLPYQRALNTPFRRLDGPNVDGKMEVANFSYVTPDYFRTLRIPILRGRALSAADGPRAAGAAVVNEAFVRKYLAHQEPLGSHLDFGESREIVGVVGDVQEKAGWGDFGPLGKIPAVFVPVAQVSGKALQLWHTWFSPSWIVRASGPQEGLIAGIERAVETLDPQLPFAAFRTMDDVRSRSLSEQRFQATLLAILAGLALLLAAVGIYGLIAHSVVERRRELGIRLALGATLGQAVRAAALPGITLALAGVALGCLLAAFAVQVLRRLVWGVSPADPATFVAVAFGLLLVAAASSYLPALGVARIHPAATLREE